MTSLRINPFLKRKRFLKEQLFSKRTFPFLAQVLSLERKCVDVRGMFDGEEAKRKELYYRKIFLKQIWRGQRVIREGPSRTQFYLVLNCLKRYGTILAFAIDSDFRFCLKARL